jgi:hypothetical protein
VPASGDSEDDCGDADGMYNGMRNRSSRRKPISTAYSDSYTDLRPLQNYVSPLSCLNYEAAAGKFEHLRGQRAQTEWAHIRYIAAITNFVNLEGSELCECLYNKGPNLTLIKLNSVRVLHQ